MNRQATEVMLTREVERSLLRLICLETTGTQLREQMLARLRTYAFRSVEHRVLFDCLQGMPFDRPELIRELLPARLVRAGFPEFNLDPFFESHGLNSREAREHCQALTDSQSAERSRKTAEDMARWDRGQGQQNLD